MSCGLAMIVHGSPIDSGCGSTACLTGDGLQGIPSGVKVEVTDLGMELLKVLAQVRSIGVPAQHIDAGVHADWVTVLDEALEVSQC